MASKSASFFRKFFKLIFSLAGLVAAVLAVVLMALPFTSLNMTVLQQNIVFGVSGFAWAFGGDPSVFLNGEAVDLSEVSSDLSQIGFETNVEPNTGIMITAILLIVGAVLALIYVLFCWGKKNPSVKKGIGGFSALVLLAGGIMSFFATNMTEWEVASESAFGIEYVSGLGVGAILCGILGIIGFVLMGVATLLGPKEN